jgi:hypothetical protein
LDFRAILPNANVTFAPILLCGTPCFNHRILNLKLRD